MKKLVNIIFSVILSLAFSGAVIFVAFKGGTTDSTPALLDTLGGLDDEPIDMEEDSDGDGIKNIDEVLKYKTNMYSADTDGDGLLDSYELNYSKTDPIKTDTDGDGLEDGVELDLGLNPLAYSTYSDGIKDSERLLSYDYEDEELGVKVALSGYGNLSNIVVREIDAFSGVVGLYSMFRVYGEGKVNQSSITVSYSSITSRSRAGLNEDNLGLFYFDYTTMKFTYIATVLDKTLKTASANIKGNANVVLADRAELAESITTDLFFVIDNSGSMFTPEQAVELSSAQGTLDDFAHFQGNDSEFKRVDLSVSLIDKLDASGEYRFGVGKFAFDYTQLSGFASSENAKTALNKIKTEKTSFTGTYIGEALYKASDTFTATDNQKYIILLTDGRDTSDNSSYNNNRLQQGITLAKNKGIKVFVIGLGNDLNHQVLNKIANDTGGLFYLASSANLLDGIYNQITRNVNFGLTDTDDDGKLDSIVNVSTGFIPSIHGFSFDNFSSVKTDMGNCYGMAAFAMLNYSDRLPVSMRETNYSKGFFRGNVNAGSYDLSEVGFYKNKQNLYSFEIDSAFADFHTSYKVMIDFESDKAVKPFKSEFRTKLDELGYQITERKNKDDVTYEYALVDVDSEKLAEKGGVFLEAQEILKAIYRLHVLQYKDERVSFSSAPDKAFEKLVKLLTDDIPFVFSMGGHAVNAIGLLQDIENPDKFLIEIYDSNHSGVTRYFHMKRKKYNKLQLNYTAWTNEYQYTFEYEDKDRYFRIADLDKTLAAQLSDDFYA